MSQVEENETHGPKVGVKVCLDQANLITLRHLGLNATSICHVDRGYNNRVYIVTTSDKHQYVLRLSGRFWTRYKTENEVATLVYIRKKCPKIPVPKVVGYCTDKYKSGVNAEYILMERIMGEPLEHIWNQLESQDKLNILNQLADIFAEIQKMTFSKLGSFQLDSERIGDCQGIGINPEKDIQVEDVKIGKGVEFDGGPFCTYLEYFKSSAETEIEFLKTTPFMQQSEGYEKRLKRIQNFISAFGSFETVPESIREALVDVPFVFTHGDFEPRNLMVNKETLEVTGILDWEFSGSYAIDEDWFTGFRFVDADTNESRVFNEPSIVLEDDDDNISKPDPEVIKPLKISFLKRLKYNKVLTPDVIPGHMIRAELYYFKGLICPWWLREDRDPVPDTHYSERENACKRVDSILDKYGF